MAAKGTIEKTAIQNKILETFEGAFMNGKELRIPMNGVEIKVALTCAKENVGAGKVSPSNEAADWSEEVPWDKPKTEELIEPSDEEKDTIKKLLEMF